MTSKMKAQDLSIIIPTFNEATRIEKLLQSLQLLVGSEYIIADGGSKDETMTIARAFGANVVSRHGGRGPQLATGVQASSRPVLWIIHADSVPPFDPLAVMTPVIARGNAGAFRLKIDHSAYRYRLVEWGVRIRNLFSGLPYGDQGLFLTRELYEQIGGFLPYPIMEDVALCQAIKQAGRKIELLTQTITTDARRYEREGILKRIVKNKRIEIRYFLFNVSPHNLAKDYLPEPLTKDKN
ncbi:uncharacterized protein LOC132564156 [Ylistrum balloti]|uniref:uncharacterized protein LOC132564156 n=1 Tax=Ylistrum balloti TaxID=509963 RepID=UPI002905D388|nr:uncharacterized protein LOC132564156 [Ylistrum balloti]